MAEQRRCRSARWTRGPVQESFRPEKGMSEMLERATGKGSTAEEREGRGRGWGWGRRGEERAEGRSERESERGRPGRGTAEEWPVSGGRQWARRRERRSGRIQGPGRGRFRRGGTSPLKSPRRR
ncbi:hypothetical protein QJS04_geneDACA024856 [Acorus gramineus]|uniref:Uncharacterized protein n=1 Tax=Acorus gramineus TaxID=55184 RepID=A0AAV8ZY74_ACOGR|nr:hypothetical protein QJS04_geneDACA024856 [Acorus gramineus]